MKKISKNWIYSLAIMGIFFMIIGGCKKKEDKSTPPAPPTSGTVKDIDGNEYHIDTIGTQIWMVENLKTTRYNNGNHIPLVTDSTAWFNLTTPGYCWYNNDITNKTPYGALYNWYAVNAGKLAPVGWHIPTAAEWTTLITYLGGVDVAGGKMKATGTIEAGTGLWRTFPNTNATNESGFTAVPGGYRLGYLQLGYGKFENIGGVSIWWSSTGDINGYLAMYMMLYFMSDGVGPGNDYQYLGYSVRCIRD
jgi:uncharacterized protein (TIGR02145 family)